MDRLGFNNTRPPLEGFYIYFLLFYIGYLVADVGALYTRQFMLPTGGGTRSIIKPISGPAQAPHASYYTNIRDRNIFNADHKVPPSLGEQKGGVEGGLIENNDPIPTTLPLELVGTIVHGNDIMSVATIQVRGQKEVEPYKVEEEIEGMAKITEILREKVIFRNMRSRKLEYVEMKDDGKIKIGLVGGGQAVAETAPAAKTNFSFQRGEINKYLENLPQILQDAKAVPYIEPGTGEMSGWKIVAIKKGSIYEKLGLERGDVLKSVNGESVDTPQKAMELYQALKDSDQIQLEISRGGSSTTLNYNIQ